MMVFLSYINTKYFNITNMKTHKTTLIFFFALLMSFNFKAQDCNYFNLPKPGTTPQQFNPEVLDLNGRFKFNVEIKSCDEVYFTSFGKTENIYVTKRKNGKWTKPNIASFSDPDFNDADPFLTQDGTQMYFISKRPTHKNDTKFDFNIWVAQRINGKWSKPEPLPSPINSDEANEYFFSISNKGNAFFASNRKGGEGSFDIYKTKILADNTFSEPENLGQPVSSETYEFDPYISLDETFMIFSINENNNSSLYVSFQENNTWSTPKNLGDKINITNQDFAPSLSADGKFLFYSNNGKLMWVSTEILKD